MMIRGRLQGMVGNGSRFRLALARVFDLVAVLAGCTPDVPGMPPVDAGLLAQGCAISSLPQPVLPAVAGDEDFPKSYDESRGRFRADCSMLEAKGMAACRRYPVADRSDPDLTIDTAYAARPGNRHLLVLQSGLHGVEAFAGAAVQRRIIKDRFDTMLDRGFETLTSTATSRPTAASTPGRIRPTRSCGA